MNNMENFEAYKEQILRNSQRLAVEDKFKFACHPGVPCFGKCCANVNIFLTPYDVLRMKNAKGISSTEFLKEYTFPLSLEENQLPVVLLKMTEDEEKKCPFVSDDGICSIYDDRPWACRMYPIGLASSKTGVGDEGEEFCFIVDEKDTLCKGFLEDNELTIKEWMDSQDVGNFNKKSESYMQFTLHPHLQEKKELGEGKIQIFFTACYDLDGFRKMIFESTFLDRFELKDELIEQLKADDEALLEFAVTKWLRFALFREDTMIIKDTEIEKGVQSLGWKVDE
ncbi:MAG: YkgJ family cysteine cluster protein [Chloroflexi bacterium]|nr:YkgJ family cysteine cluster protein [Chloroflexota bacterium]